MSTKETQKKRKKLSQELLFLMVADGVISVCVYFLLRSWAGSMAYDYCEKNQIVLDELQDITLDMAIFNLSLFCAVLVFITLFFVFMGNKLGYIRQLTAGIHALRTHRMNFEIPLKGNNELTELAESINYLAETERQLKAIERNLSHDIRTPLTAILSYSEYLQGRDDLTKEELDEFLELTKRKAEQIKVLTEQLLDGGSKLTEIEDGRLLMVQLAEEWEEVLEDTFDCQVDLTQCPTFSRQIDVEEMRRIFDNLAPNVEKYADADAPVTLEIATENGRIAIRQSNKKATAPRPVESRKIGLSSIDTIAKHHGGSAAFEETADRFAIKIILFEV